VIPKFGYTKVRDRNGRTKGVRTGGDLNVYKAFLGWMSGS